MHEKEHSSWIMHHGPFYMGGSDPAGCGTGSKPIKKEGTVEIKEILYFDEPGPSHTDDILALAKKRIEALGIQRVIIASQAGVTVKRFLEIANDLKVDVVAVTNPRGAKLNITVMYNKYKESKRIKEEYEKKGVTHFQCCISDEDRASFEKSGVKVTNMRDYLNIGDPLGLDDDRKLSEIDLEWKARRKKLRPFIAPHLRPLDIDAGADLSLLTIISQGFRVLVGVTVVAVNNGLVAEGETVLSMAGTGFAGGGTDTAAILRAGRTAKGCLVKEILGFPVLK
jgi:hypothetical protein